jgi:hypothetical protein
MRVFITAVATVAALFFAMAADANITSVDQCVPECDTHQLEWHALPIDPWLPVATPMTVGDITHPSLPGPARGVTWTGTSTFGEFRGNAQRGPDVSPYSPILPVGEPPVAPLLLSALGTILVIRRIKA